MFNWFRKDDIDFKFADTVEGSIYPHYPPILAKELKPLKEHQEKKFGDYRFPGCPGMHDYARLGYIIPAWTNFHIKANKAGTVVVLGSRGEEALKRSTMVKQPQQMAPDITDGAYTPEGGIVPSIWNCPGAWRIHGYGKVSCLLLPAFFHSNFLDDLYVYPGVVDYNGFTVINFIFSAKRPCEVEIKAGDPLLQVIPFITSKDIVASYGPATQHEKDYGKISKWFHETNFYRRYYMIRKKFKLVKDFE